MESDLSQPKTHTAALDVTVERRPFDVESLARSLREARAEKRALLEICPDAVVAIDDSGNIVDFNRAAEVMFGRSRADVVGRRPADTIIPPESHEKHETSFARFLETGESTIFDRRIELTGMRADGSTFPCEVVITSVQGGRGVVGYIRDLSYERRTAEDLADLQSLTDTALTYLSLDELLHEVLQRLQHILEVDTMAILLLTDDDKLVMRAAIGMEVDPTFRIPIGYGIAGRIAAGRKPVVMNDVEHIGFVAPAMMKRGIRSIAGVPLFVDGAVVGVLHAGSLRKREFTDNVVSWLELAADRIARAIDHARLYEREHKIAQTLQLSLLPERLPSVPGISLAVRYLPAAAGTQVGGDWYDVIRLPDGRVGIAVGDVAGKGIRAAAIMGQLRNALRAYAFEGYSPSVVLARLDQLMHGLDQGEMATVVYGTLDPGSGNLQFASAGHPPVLYLGADGSGTFLDDGRGVPLGVAPGFIFEESSIVLAPGSTLLLYSDGLVERRWSTLDAGLAGLESAVATAPGELESMCDSILDSMFPDGSPKDDVALVALRFLPTEDEDLRLVLPARKPMLSALRRALENWLSRTEATPEESFEILVAVNEAAANAIEHAYGPDEAEYSVHVRLENGVVHVAVRDQGRWRLPRPSDRGRGIALMRSLMDDVEISPTPEGTDVLMRRRLAQATTG